MQGMGTQIKDDVRFLAQMVAIQENILRSKISRPRTEINLAFGQIDKRERERKNLPEIILWASLTFAFSWEQLFIMGLPRRCLQ